MTNTNSAPNTSLPLPTVALLAEAREHLTLVADVIGAFDHLGAAVTPHYENRVRTVAAEVVELGELIAGAEVTALVARFNEADA